MFPEKCYCPKKDLDEVSNSFKCPETNERIYEDLQRFQQIDFKDVREKILIKFHNPNRQDNNRIVIKHYI